MFIRLHASFVCSYGLSFDRFYFFICSFVSSLVFFPLFILGLFTSRSIIDLRDIDKYRYSTNVAFLVFSLFFFLSAKDVKSVSDSSANRSAIFTEERDFNYA